MKTVYFLALIALTSCIKYDKVDLVVHNAKIYTLEGGEIKIAQAMAIKDGKIVAIDKEREIMNQYRADEFFDAETRPIFPGFIDAHCHFLGSGLNWLAVDLKKAMSKEDILVEIISHNIENNELEWVVGFGWDENNWKDKTITNDFLNKKFPKMPVLLWRIDGHSLLVNEAAIKLVNPLSEIKNGIVTEKDISLFISKINYTNMQKKIALKLAQKDCFKYGITTVSDAGLNLDEILLIKELQDSFELEMRIYAMLNSTKINLNHFSKNGKDSTDKMSVNSVKVWLDGSVGSMSACMKKPYAGTRNYGSLLITKDSLKKIAKYCYKNDFQLNVHCIGDSAVKVALDVMGEVLQTQNDRRWRIEHAQTVDELDIGKFLKYSILPSVQPTHGLDDEKMASKKLTKTVFEKSYKIRDLLDQNGMIAFGTDFPVADKNPIVTFYNAVVRKSNSAVISGQKVTREQAILAMTLWAAMANHQENNRGSLEVGKYADFVILDRDILKIKEENILKTQVKFTFLDGNIVFQE